MEPMTLDEAKLVMRGQRACTNVDLSRAAQSLYNALGAAEARAEAAEKRVADLTAKIAAERDQFDAARKAANEQIDAKCAEIVTLLDRVFDAENQVATSSDTARLHRIREALTALVPLDGTMGVADDVQRLRRAIENARADAIEEAAKVAESHADAAMRARRDSDQVEARTIANAIRALAPKPPAEPDPLFEDLKRESARSIPKKVLHPAPAEPRAPEAPFDARKAWEAFQEALYRTVRINDAAWLDQCVREALAAGSAK